MVDRFPEIPGITSLFSDDGPLTVTPERREHILRGDPDLEEGGHAFGAGVPGASEFPEDWTGDDIIGAIESIANDGGIHADVQPSGRLKKIGVIDGLEIEVIIDPVEGI